MVKCADIPDAASTKVVPSGVPEPGSQPEPNAEPGPISPPKPPTVSLPVCFPETPLKMERCYQGKCLNGGSCDDKTGTCSCIKLFSGERCEEFGESSWFSSDFSLLFLSAV